MRCMAICIIKEYEYDCEIAVIVIKLIVFHICTLIYLIFSIKKYFLSYYTFLIQFNLERQRCLTLSLHKIIIIHLGIMNHFYCLVALKYTINAQLIMLLNIIYFFKYYLILFTLEIIFCMQTSITKYQKRNSV